MDPFNVEDIHDDTRTAMRRLISRLLSLNDMGTKMKSGKQRRTELDAKKKARAAKVAAEKAKAARATLEFAASCGAPVNLEALASHNSYSEPDFVTRGFYSDQPFECQDCGKDEVWTATQQKWWYEIAKGDVFTTASRCRACRRRERERRTEARRVHLEGLARKRGKAT